MAGGLPRRMRIGGLPFRDNGTTAAGR
jgi:hypothetical protein